MSSTGIGGSLIAGSQSTTSSGGLGAGIDVSALVSASLADQTAELTVLQNQQTQLTDQQSALNSFNTDLQTLQNAVFALTDPAGQLTDVAATSSNSAIVTANAISGTPTGTHTVVVTNLATTSSEYSSELASSSTPLATGTLTVQVGTNTAVPIPVTSANNTLTGLAASINNANAGVTASVITDANGARLSIVSNTSGAPGDLTVTASAGLPTFTKPVTGVNAQITVDGVPVASTTNTVTSAIPGVTLSLNSQSPGTPVTISTTPDVTNQEDAINSFVSAYNTVVGDLNAQFSISSSTGQPGPLSADSTLSLAQSQILAAGSFSTTGNGAVNSLADLGISFNNDGTLSVDSGTLTSALEANPAAVQSFFQATTAGSFGANLTNNLTALADPISGSIAQDINGLTQSQTSLTQQISDFQAQLNTQQQALTTQYDQVDVTLQELPLLLSQVSQQLTSLG
ncbi:MAG: flagellar filament capping protein FliD [Candidatus Acidiferrales bacterium]